MKQPSQSSSLKFYLFLLIFVALACSRVTIDLSPPPGPAPPAATPTAPPPTPTATPWPTLVPTSSPTITPAPTPELLSCPLPDLTVEQHISTRGSYTETQWVASGPMICRIDRDSCAYQYLVGLLDPTIVFKREENPPYDTEDILLHPAMLAPLSRLSRLVLAEWDGEFSLRVTDTYDSLLEHDLNQTDTNRKYSLHFEGRAIDLTLWPIDRSRYGRLCALAHCAGFDWVHHEGSHCHASIRAKSLCMQCSQ